jgi:hypothetical protein
LLSAAEKSIALFFMEANHFVSSFWTYANDFVTTGLWDVFMKCIHNVKHNINLDLDSIVANSNLNDDKSFDLFLKSALLNEPMHKSDESSMKRTPITSIRSLHEFHGKLIELMLKCLFLLPNQTAFLSNLSLLFKEIFSMSKFNKQLYDLRAKYLRILSKDDPGALADSDSHVVFASDIVPALDGVKIRIYEVSQQIKESIDVFRTHLIVVLRTLRTMSERSVDQNDHLLYQRSNFADYDILAVHYLLLRLDFNQFYGDRVQRIG